MSPTRLEAFTDAVIAIIKTVMVLELRAPHSPDLSALWPLAPVFLSYLLSFANLGIYWSNHHHIMLVVEKVSGSILLANLLHLFCLSLIPFATVWMGENHGASVPTAAYGIVQLMAGASFYLLEVTIIKKQGADSLLQSVLGTYWKGKLSLLIYLASVPIAFFRPWIDWVIYFAIAFMWLIPDPRFERALAEREKGEA